MLDRKDAPSPLPGDEGVVDHSVLDTDISTAVVGHVQVPATGPTEPTFTVTVGGSHLDTEWSNILAHPWDKLQDMFTRHEPGLKEGTCIVPARFRGTARRQSDAEQIDIVMLDSDCGHALPEIEAAIRAQGWAAICHSTHSHMIRHTKLSTVALEKFRISHPIGAEYQYLIEEKGYLPAVADGAHVVEDDGKHVTFEHAPCPKFRIILRLATPWRAADYPDQGTANEAWKSGINALAASLGLHHDQSCTDTSRLFFMPRYPEGGPTPETLVIEGADCDLWALLEAAEAGSSSGAGPSSAPKAKPGGTEHVTFTDPESGKVRDLTKWAAKYGGQF